MPDFNFLANIGRQQAGGDIVDSLGRGFQLGRNIGMIPYQNALVTEKMAEIERLKQARNAMSEYGTTGDIQPLMGIDPVKAFELQDKKAILELRQSGVADKNMETGLNAITKLAPMINEQNYPQVKATVDKLFGSSVMPDKYDPQAVAKISAFASRTKGITALAPGAIGVDVLGNKVVENPYQLTPYQEGSLELRRKKLEQPPGGGRPDVMTTAKAIEAAYQQYIQTPGNEGTTRTQFRTIWEAAREAGRPNQTVTTGGGVKINPDGTITTGGPRTTTKGRAGQGETKPISPAGDIQGTPIGKTPDGRTVYEGPDGKRFTTE